MSYKMDKVCFLLLLLYFIVSCSSGNSVTVLVSNNSGLTINKLRIEVSGKSQTITSLKSGKSATLQYLDLSDSHYTLNGALKDGTPIEGDFGYVTHGMDFESSFNINKGGKVEFTSSPK